MFHQISKHCYMLDFNPDTDRPNLVLIQGDKYTIQIDAGNSKAHLSLFNKECEKFQLKKPDLCILTHWHWDHTFGMHALNCPSLCSKETQNRLDIVKQWKWDDASMQARLASNEEIEFCDINIKKEYPDCNQIKVVNATSSFEGTIRFDLGDVHLTAITTNSPHSKDATIILAEEDRILFVADADCEDFYHGAIYDKERLTNFIHLVESLDYDTYIVGHAEPENKKDALARLYNTLEQL